jgi:hypothetical protein
MAECLSLVDSCDRTQQGDPMNLKKHLAIAVTTGLLLTAAPVPMAAAHTTGIHDNCTKLNQRYPHGLGRRNAVDKTTGTPVRNFHRNTKAYKRAISHNSTLDRDKDGIACEKR